MKAFLLLALLILSSCGWEPVYGELGKPPISQPEKGFNRVKIGLIPNRDGQFLRNSLIDRFYTNGYPNNPQYNLDVQKLRERISDFDITIESEATRRQIEISTTMSVTDLHTGETLLTRNLDSVTSFNVLESEYATQVSENDAREAALNDLARQIERQLALFFNNQ